MTGSSGPTIASTFWKKTIHGAISCDQLTFFDSSSCSRKFPAVWKNFFGAIGARSFASASGVGSPASSAPPRSKYSRIVGTSSRTISSPSMRPTFPSSYVTSFIAPTLPSSASDLVVAVADPALDVGIDRVDAEMVDEEVLLVRRDAADARVAFDAVRDVEVAEQLVALRPRAGEAALRALERDGRLRDRERVLATCGHDGREAPPERAS